MSDKSSSQSSSEDAMAKDVRAAINQIEEAYEFMLAYAAQGRQHEAETEGESQIRGFLVRFRSALDSLSSCMPGLLSADGHGAAFAKRFAEDVAVMQSILDLITNQDSISSDMIDNTNGLIAVRALLTDLFFVDQVVLTSSPKIGA